MEVESYIVPLSVWHVRIHRIRTEYTVDIADGGWPLKRYIQKYVETLSAKLILADQVSSKDTILIEVAEDKLSARRK